MSQQLPNFLHIGPGKSGSTWLHEVFISHPALIQRTLYKPLGPGRPTMSADDIVFVREQLAGEIAGVEEEFGISLRQRWGWQ
jgi:hypothetical protein